MSVLGGLLLPDTLVELYLLVGPVGFFIAGWWLHATGKIPPSKAVSSPAPDRVLVPVTAPPPVGVGVISSPAPVTPVVTQAAATQKKEVPGAQGFYEVPV